METPRHWRARKQRYGTGEGGLIGTVCPICGAPIFPANRPVCTTCASKMNEKVINMGEAVGVGAIIFVPDENGKLNLLLFPAVDTNPTDNDTQKAERILDSGKPFRPLKGWNTITGKVDDEQALEYSALLDFPPEFLAMLLETILREVAEEAPGMELKENDVHYFSESSARIQQKRPLKDQEGVKGLYDFKVFVLAILLKMSNLENLQRPYELIPIADFKNIFAEEMRPATEAVLDFLLAALLFLSAEGKIDENLIPESVAQPILTSVN